MSNVLALSTLLILSGVLQGKPAPPQIPKADLRAATQPRTEPCEPLDRFELLALIIGSANFIYPSQEAVGCGIAFIPDKTYLDTLQALSPAARDVFLEGWEEYISIHRLPSDPAREAAYERLASGARLMAKGDYAAAEPEFRAALEKSPESAGMHAATGMLLLLLKRPKEAIAFYEQSLRRNSRNPDTFAFLATAQHMSGDRASAAHAYRTALQLQPEHEVARAFLAVTLSQDGRCEEALPELRASRRMAGVLHVPKYIGICLLHSGESAAAVNELEGFLTQHPEDAEAHFFLASALEKQDNYRRALEHYEKAIELDPANIIYQQAYQRLRNRPKA